MKPTERRRDALMLRVLVFLCLVASTSYAKSVPDWLPIIHSAATPMTTVAVEIMG